MCSSVVTELTLKSWPLSSDSLHEPEVSVHGPLIDMLWVRLGCSQKWFLMALYLELTAENPGSERRSWTAVLPSSMLTTWDIFGLRVGEALVHNRATFSITIVSSDEYSEPKAGSTNSNRLPLSCKTYACKENQFEIAYTYIWWKETKMKSWQEICAKLNWWEKHRIKQWMFR